MNVVINSGPISFLSKIDRIWILNNLFEKVLITKEVLEEVSSCKIAGTERQLCMISHEIIKIANQMAVLGMLGRLHIGEVEVIVGAIEQGG